MEMTSLITSLKKNKNKINFELYLFGSALSKDNCNDIDLLIVYDKKDKQDIEKALKFRKKLYRIIFKLNHKKAHICLLTKNEKEYKLFIKQEFAKKIFKYQFQNTSYNECAEKVIL